MNTASWGGYSRDDPADGRGTEFGPKRRKVKGRLRRCLRWSLHDRTGAPQGDTRESNGAEHRRAPFLRELGS